VISATKDGLLVGTGRRAYLLEEVQIPGRRPMPARQLLP
jgi:methionyl-tRNA formyltransferase